MGWNAETGMWEPDVFRQALGAPGAAMNFMNARRATELSDTLEREREAQAAAQEQQTAERLSNQQMEDEARKAVGDLPPDATADQIANTYARYNPKAGMPWARSSVAAAGKGTTERMRQAGLMYRSAILAGQTPAQAQIFLKAQGYSPEELAAMPDTTTAAPLPAATAAERRARAGKEEMQTALMPDESAARIALANARAELDRTMSRLRQKIGLGGKLGKDERAAIAQKISSMIAQRDTVENKVDPMTGMKRKVTPTLQAELDKMDSAINAAIDALHSAEARSRVLAPKAPAGTGLSAEAQALMPP